MIERFPFRNIPDYLEANDFSLFTNSFTQLIAGRIPYSGHLYFINKAEGVPKIFNAPQDQNYMKQLLPELLSGSSGPKMHLDTLFFPFPLWGGSATVAVMTGVDHLLSERASSDWLGSVCHDLHRDFILVKQAYKDPETGLLNSSHLFSVLETVSSDISISVILIDIPVIGTRAKDAFSYAQSAAETLTHFIESRFLIHHIGQGVFAIAIRSDEISSIDQFTFALVQSLKNDKFDRVHLGSCHARKKATILSEDGAFGQWLLDRAWTALLRARKRGPFSFCDYGTIESDQKHPLAPAEKGVVNCFIKASKDCDAFCLLELGGVASVFTDRCSGLIRELHPQADVISDAYTIYVYLPEVNDAEASKIARALLDSLNREDGEEGYIGIGCYPYLNYTKKQVLQNARKALLHSEFFGSGHAVVFDSVSLNISGDVFFSDGNLSKAVKEYRKGLEINPEDVNLLNSLGVTYALMNRNALARRMFERAVEIEPENHMALYNLGLGAQQRNEISLAIDFFERALSYCAINEDDKGIINDLHLQLGILHCQARGFADSLKYLEQWFAQAPSQQHGRAMRYMGEACLGTGEPKEAMNWLQKSLGQKEYDPEILSLYGLAVLEAGQGEDIALSFCTRAVELMPSSHILRLRLAHVQVALKQYHEALTHLKMCKGKGRELAQARLLRAQAYAGLNRWSRAREWAEKCIAACAADNDPLSKRAQVVLKAL